MSKSLIQRTVEHVKSRLMREGSGHDWFHTYRVWQLSKYIQSKEGGDLEFIEVAALLHCAAEHDLRAKHTEQIRSITMSGVLDVLEIPEEWREHVISVAEWCRYKGRDTQSASTLEGRIVQDANYLDTLGAIGLARGFTAGGYLGRVIHDPVIKPLLNANKDAYQNRKREGTSVNYFIEKTLQLLPLMNTETGKRVAEKRIQFTKKFIDEFLQEWDMEDVKD